MFSTKLHVYTKHKTLSMSFSTRVWLDTQFRFQLLHPVRRQFSGHNLLQLIFWADWKIFDMIDFARQRSREYIEELVLFYHYRWHQQLWWLKTKMYLKFDWLLCRVFFQKISKMLKNENFEKKLFSKYELKKSHGIVFFIYLKNSSFRKLSKVCFFGML